MTHKTLLVRAVGDVLVPDYAAAEANHRRFVGREIDHPWAAVAEPCQVPSRAEYVAHLRSGELEPCDAATAAACGVKLKSK